MLGFLNGLATRWLQKGSATRVTASLVGSTAVGQVLVFASTPLISRLYSPAEIGQFGLFFSFLTVSSVAVTARYELAIPGARDDPDAIALVRLSFTLSLLISLVCAGVLWLAIKWHLLSFELLPHWTPVALYAALVAIGLVSALRYWFVRKREFDVIGRVQLVQGLGRAVVPVFLGLFHVGTLGLIVGEIAGRLLGVGRMLSALVVSLPESQKGGRASSLAVARIYWKYPAVLLPSGILDMLTTALPLPLLSARYGVAVAGTFLIVQRLSMIPAALLATSVGDVFHSTIVESLRTGDPRAKSTLNRWAWHLMRLGLAVMLPAAVLAPFVLPWLLGPEWKNAGLLFALVAPWSLASLIVSPLSRILAIVERKELKFAYDIVALGLLVGSIWLSSKFDLGLVATVGLLSAGQVAAYILYFFLMQQACDFASSDALRSRPIPIYDAVDLDSSNP